MKHKTIKIGYKNYEFKKIDKDFSDSHGQFLSREGLIGLSE